MTRDVSFGQYMPGDGVIHRLDPRIKLILLIAYIVFVFCAFNFVSLAVISAATFAAVMLSRVPLRMYFKSLKVVLIIVLITSALNIFYGGGDVLWQWGYLTVTKDGIFRAIFVSVRIVLLILLSSCLTFTTTPTDLTDAIERLMKPLKALHVKVHEIAMMMTIALRFVPTLLEETDKIMSAQKARGADMDSGGIIKKVKAMTPILIPLFVSAFRRAYELAVAMECRCYHGGDGRTRMKVLHMKPLDYVSLVISGIVLAGIVLCNVFFASIV
ncbi:MAG: energy-coupling factor transporter transmembrane component T [Ruminococcus sp.]|jgi:energy-coupling factor transport system permease protein|nr:energy-coupling factor transporter transmembrane component T [Ruminococcus sp.]